MATMRQIDNLGRVVIPKELRNELGITTGDYLEITRVGNKVCFEKFVLEDSLCVEINRLIDCIGITDYTKSQNYGKEYTDILKILIEAQAKLAQITEDKKNEDNGG